MKTMSINNKRIKESTMNPDTAMYGSVIRDIVSLAKELQEKASLSSNDDVWEDEDVISSLIGIASDLEELVDMIEARV